MENLDIRMIPEMVIPKSIVYVVTLFKFSLIGAPVGT